MNNEYKVGDKVVRSMNLARMGKLNNMKIEWIVTRVNKSSYSVHARSEERYPHPNSWALNLYMCKNTGRIKR